MHVWVSGMVYRLRERERVSVRVGERGGEGEEGGGEGRSGGVLVQHKVIVGKETE